MPRNASGTSTLVAGNPVATNTIIESDWANTTMADLNNEMTDSLSRSGKGGMTAQFRAVNGSAPTPAISFSDFPQSGMYAFSENDIRMSVAGVDRFRWLQANALPQTWDSGGSTWLDVGGGGVIWTQMDVAPATAAISTGYVTLGGQTIAMPANPPTGFSVAFADKADDWDATNYLTITGNGNTFSQDSSGTYILDLKGAFAQFSYLEGQWQIVNFGRLSDAYGFDGNDFERKDQAYQKNKIINGGMQIYQRGIVDLTNNVFAYGGADRYVNIPTGFTTFTGTARRGGNPATGGGLANGGLSASGYVHIINVTAVTGTGSLVVEYRIEAEDAILLANREQTFSCTTYASTGMAAGASINTFKPNAKDDWSAVTLLPFEKVGTAPTTTRLLESVTFTPTTADVENGFGIRLTFTGVTTIGDCQTGDWQLTESAEVLPWRSAGASLAEELAMCQRYYEKSYQQSQFAGAAVSSGVFGWTGRTGGTQSFNLGFAVTKRTTPLITFYSSTTGTPNTARNDTKAADTTISGGLYTGESGTAGAVIGDAATGGNILKAQWTANAEL